MAQKRIPIGISDFKNLIEGNYYYVDKTLLIKDIWDKGQIVLAPRPRRFGKTLNLSMLRYFFEASEHSNAHLFEDKNIWDHSDIQALQGQFPVIFITFKNIKELTWDLTYEKFAYALYEEFARHKPVLFNDSLEDYDKERYKRILEGVASQGELANSLAYGIAVEGKQILVKLIVQ